MQSEGPESTNRRRLEAYDGRSSGDKWEVQGLLEPYDNRRLATYGPSSADTCEKQGLRAARGRHLGPMMAAGWQRTAKVAGTHAKRRA